MFCIMSSIIVCSYYLCVLFIYFVLNSLMTNLYKAELFSEKCFKDTFKIEVASYRLMYSRVL